MANNEINKLLLRIDELADEINQFVPNSMTQAVLFRADLAGLLVVLITASYESCIKHTLVSYATSRHAAFGTFAQNNFAKLNSRIDAADLFKYTKTFDPNINKKFKEYLSEKKQRILRITGRDIEASYSQMLEWRHAYAHASRRNTTIEEAITTHRFAKHVLYCFDYAFSAAAILDEA